MGVTIIEIAIGKDQLLNDNYRLGHHMAKAVKTKALRSIGKNRGRQLGKLDWPCDLRIEIAPITRGRFDASNMAPTVKALVDGLVDAGCLPDDSDKELRETTYVRIPRPGTGRGVRPIIGPKEYLFRLIFIPVKQQVESRSNADSDD